MPQNQSEEIRSIFFFAKNKKILIYGTGAASHELLCALYDFQIVGCLDRNRVDGEIKGVPIITWDDVEENSADILIIAAAHKNYREIYDRIIYRCSALRLDIYGHNGDNLKERYFFHTVYTDSFFYYKKSESELKKIIEDYDAVSFDMFDTLVMRKTLEPSDIFDLVEDRLKAKGLHVPQFKKKRQVAEQKTPGGNIYQIYETLGAMFGFSQAECGIILKEEIRCEKDCIIPRNIMVEIFYYALSLGKTVNIITDMHFTASIIEDILSGVGIEGYNKVYVSCEYGIGKGSGLFSVYLEAVSGLRCLHIGDDKQSDIEAAQQNGIAPYYIKSAYELLKISNFRKCLLFEMEKNDRIWIGLLISELFNNPFVLNQSSGILKITEARFLGSVFYAPIVVAYLQELYDILKSQKYDGVLFGARDGYLFKKIYDSGVMGTPPAPSIYLLTSRKLAFKSMMRDEEDINTFIQYMQTFHGKKLNDTLCELFGNDCIVPFHEEISIKIDAILSMSEKTRENYIIYMKKNGINLSGKYLYCDLCAQGTSQAALNKIMVNTQDGFYVRRFDSIFNLSSTSYFKKQEFNKLSVGLDFLEIVLSAPAPSVCDIDQEGSPIYAEESRSPEVLHAFHVAQKGIEDIIAQYYTLYQGDNHYIDKNMVSVMLESFQDTIFEGEASILSELTLTSDLVKTPYNVWIKNEQY